MFIFTQKHKLISASSVFIAHLIFKSSIHYEHFKYQILYRYVYLLSCNFMPMINIYMTGKMNKSGIIKLWSCQLHMIHLSIALIFLKIIIHILDVHTRWDMGSHKIFRSHTGKVSTGVISVYVEWNLDVIKWLGR